MPNYTEQDIQSMIKFSDELFLHCRKEFGQIYKIDNIDLLGASEYLAYVIYPNNLKERVKFYNSAIWLAIKANPSICKAESKELIRVMFGDNHNKFNFKNTEQHIVKSSKILSKRIQAAHSFQLSLNLSSTLNESLLAVDLAYKAMNGKQIDLDDLNYDPDYYLANAKKEIRRPSRGVIHLIYGFIEACFYKYPREDRHIKAALIHPSWVSEAIKISEWHLKSRLLDHYYREKGVKTGTNLYLDFSEIILLTR